MAGKAASQRKAAAARHGGEQLARVIMLRIGEERSGRAGLDNAPALHHCDAVADLRSHTQVVRDEQDGKAEPLLDILDQRQDLRLNRDIERRDGLVRDQHVGLECQSAGDADALALPA